MSFWPLISETIVGSSSKADLIKKLKIATLEPDEIKPDGEEGLKILFNGTVQSEYFRISLLLKRPNNFVPLIRGHIESTNTGSILFLRFSLFPSTRTLLIFWSVLCFLFTLFFAIPYQAYLYAAITFGLGVVNYVISVENFRTQVRKSRRALIKALED